VLIVVNVAVFFLFFFLLWYVKLLANKLFIDAQSNIKFRFQIVSIFASIAFTGLFAVFSYLKIKVLMNTPEQPFFVILIAFIVGAVFLLFLLVIAFISINILFKPSKVCFKCNISFLASTHILGNQCSNCNEIFGDELWLKESQFYQ
jgi:hypothetical protein